MTISGHINHAMNAASPADQDDYAANSDVVRPDFSRADLSDPAAATVPHVAIIFDNFGPYHVARLRAAAGRLRVSAIELAGGSDEYDWSAVEGAVPFERTTLFPSGTSSQRSTREIGAAMTAALDRIAPDVVAIPGWSDRGGLWALRWARQHRVRAIVMSASNVFDRRRNRLREDVKRGIVGFCSAGLAGGTEGAAYLRSLGLPPDRIEVGYDSVDNAYFEQGAALAVADAVAVRLRFGLPERYFLCSCRFIPKKNLEFLIDAYAAFRSSRGGDVWPLVLVGDGAMRPALEAQVAALGLTGAVQFSGFIQYRDLPSYYGLAGGFVLASTVEQWGLVVNEAMASGLPVLVSQRCGCARDLVVEGKNGFTFDPTDRSALVRGLGAIADAGPEMGEASRAIIADWAPDRFARSLAAMATMALDHPQPRSSSLGRLALEVMLRS